MIRRLEDRFVLGRCLGTGAFGTVHEAEDLATGERVALKRLTRIDPTAILRFKREFRALADVTHPSLVRLRELFAVGDEWCFTMDLVDGRDFVSAVRDADEPHRRATVVSSVEPAAADGAAAPVERPPAAAPPDEELLRRLLRGLAAGVHALHRAAKLHRDLKPSNVLVTPESGVVLLDFGLVADVSQHGLDESADQPIAGTPAYMAPEQASGEPATEAADWYAVGVMLFESLTGRVPFEGGLLEILERKQREEPPDPRALVPGLPADLAELCRKLLQRDPSARPTDDDVLAALALRGGARTSSGTVALPWVGRTDQMAALSDALERSAAGHPVLVTVRGPSGMGKSALVRRFLRGPAFDRGAAVLWGRCHERETLPYKALDGAVDALSAVLRSLPRDVSESLVPRDALSLTRVFPVLRRVDVLNATGLRPPPQDPVELRRRAVRALRELLGRVCDRGPLVLAIDDLQWADDDSLDLIAVLLRPPDAPSMLTVVLLDTSEWSDGRCRRSLAALDAVVPPGAPDRVDLELGPLAPADAQVLAEALASESGADAHEVAAAAGGSPLLLRELARRTAGAAATHDTSGTRSNPIASRVRAVTGDARAVLSLLAVAAGPVTDAVLRDAVDPALDLPATLAGLSAAGLVQPVELPGSGSGLELGHDRIRRAVLGSLDASALVAAHRSLVGALERSSHVDHAALAMHLRAVGDHARARRHAVLAAEQAMDALAFDQAVDHYRAALESADPGDAERLARGLATALANAGRGAEAGAAYEDAAAHARDRSDALELRGLAAQQYLRAGHLQEGFALADALIADLGSTADVDDDELDAALAAHRARSTATADAESPGSIAVRSPRRLEMELSWSIAAGLAGVDPLRGRAFHHRALRSALEADEGLPLARALSWEAILLALAGEPSSRARASELAADAEALAERLAHPQALAWAIAAAAVTAACEARWRRTADLCEYAEALFRQEGTGIAWEVGTLLVWWRLPALVHLGAVTELAQRIPDLLHEASERGDRYTATTARVHVLPHLLLWHDQPADALAEVDDALTHWPTGWHLQHWAAASSRAEALLYRGEADAALETAERTWATVVQSGQQALEHVRIRSAWVRARAALAASRRSDAAPLGIAHAAHESLLGDASPWAEAVATSIQASIHAHEGQRAAALAMLERAATSFEALEMRLLAAAARVQLARLEGGQASEVAAHDALVALGSAGVVRPEALAVALIPLR